MNPLGDRTTLRAAWSGLLLLTSVALMSACQDDPPPPTSPTQPSVADTPTTVPAEPTRTPVAGPVQASNAPIPTPTPSPVPEPTEAPEPAAKVIDLAREEMDAAGSLAFVIRFNLNLVQGGRSSSILVTYVGDARDDGYSSNRVTVAAPNGTVESPVIVLAPGVLVLDESTGEWRVEDGESPYFLDLLALFWFRPEVPADLEMTGRELVDGVETYRVEGRLSGLDTLGARGDLEVTYWIGAEDGLVRKVSASGQLDLDEDTALIGDLNAEEASINLTAKLFDHGKHVAIVTPTLAVPRFGHEAVLLDDGRVLIGGGFTGNANNNVIVQFPLGLVQLYEPETGLWTTLEPVEGPGLGYSLVKLVDGGILFVGLEGDEDQARGMASIFDPDSDSWTPLPGSPSPRPFPSLALLADGRVLVAGGLDVSGANSPFSLPEAVNAVEILDPNTGDWQMAASMNRALPEQSLYSLRDGRVLALGVERDGSSDPTAHAEVYDPANDTWTLVASPNPFYVPTDAIEMSDGRLLVVGVLSGYDGQFPEAQIFDPASATWTPGGEMAHARPSATLALLRDDRVLAVGGEYAWGEGFPSYSTTEILDPSTLSWSVGPDLSELRGGSSATLLPDGNILLAGGIGMALDIEEIYPLASSEVVDPNSPGMGAPGVAFRKPPFSGCEPPVATAQSVMLPPMEAPPPPQSVLDASVEAMEKVESYHMEVALDITPEGEDAEERTSLRLIIDSESLDRLQLCVSQSDSFGMYESQVVRIGDVVYTAYPDSGEWAINEFSGESIDFLYFTDDSLISSIKEPFVAGLEILNGVKVYRVTGTVPAASLASTTLLGDYDFAKAGELKAVYWIGIDDSLVRKFVAEGTMELATDEVVDFFMSVVVSDFGEVRVEAPETGFPLDTSAR